MRRSLKAFLFSAFLLASQSALAVCTGPAGIPFNCTAAVSGPTANDLVLGGVTSGAQNGQTVRWAWGQVFTGTTLTSPIIINGTINSLNSPLVGLYGGTGAANSGKTITLGGNYATSGAHNLTFTLTGDTNLTLPTSGTIFSNALPNGDIFVGNASNVATGVAMSGDCGIINTGAITCTKVNGKTVSLVGNLSTTGGTSTLAMALGGNTSITLPTSGTLQTNALASGHLFVGSAGNVATDVAVTGVIAISNTGVTSFTGGSSLIGIQSFCASGCTNTAGTYTPSAGTNRIILEMCGGGAAGGGAPATPGGQVSVGGGGGAGALLKQLITSGFSGVNVTLGAGGAGSAGATGGNGGNSTFGALATAAGGSGGTAAGPGTSVATGGGAGGAAPSTGFLRVAGQAGNLGVASNADGRIGQAVNLGGASGYGNFGNSLAGAATGYCAGGAGSINGSSSSAAAGGAGSPGIAIIYEYN